MKNEAYNNNQVDYLRLLQYFTIILLLLYLGQALFIPLSFALFLSFIIYPVSTWLEGKKFPRALAILTGLAAVSLPLIGIVVLMIRQLIVFAKQWPDIQAKIILTINRLYIFIAGFTGIPPEAVQEWVNRGLKGSSSELFLPLLKNTLTVSSVSLVLALLIPVYVMLILYYRRTFILFLVSVIPRQTEESIRSVLHETSLTYYKFIKGMLVVYLIVGMLNATGLYILGIPDAFFYGILASVLTIVPYVGIIIGAIVPVAIAWTVYDSIWYPLGIIAVFSFVQILEANVIFPLAVGKRLEVNPFIILIVVIGGGIVWGVSGMILFIPFTGILKLISDKVAQLKPLSILLGGADQRN